MTSPSTPKIDGPPSTHPLRERLATADLVAHVQTMYDGHPSLIVHSDAVAADRALAVFAAYLRDEAGDIEAEHGGEAGGHGPIIEHLRWLADSISPEATP